ncbi:maltose acetyltransferase domain-containing protein [uncultured Nostoc sp.]|uniref:maltose acetyltransferase domain-containing protein n=1 Tax=uncultured Nostoc sp. TaxID=340711 RepID=UPI0035CC62B8
MLAGYLYNKLDPELICAERARNLCQDLNAIPTTFPAGMLAADNPCRVIRELTDI